MEVFDHHPKFHNDFFSLFYEELMKGLYSCSSTLSVNLSHRVIILVDIYFVCLFNKSIPLVLDILPK